MSAAAIPGLVVDEHQALLDETATAVFSQDRRYRYLLTRTWDPELPAALWVMLNPSTADAFTEDATIRRVIGFSRAWNAGGIIVANLFGLRATDPKRMLEHRDPVGADNDRVLHQALTGGPQRPHIAIAAWGVHGTHRGRDTAVTRLLAAKGVQLQCLGLTRDGHPRHPLYVAAAQKPAEYRPGMGERQGRDTNRAGQPSCGRSDFSGFDGEEVAV